MKLLYAEKVRTGRPITTLILEAVVERYMKDGDQPCRVKSER